MDRRTILRRAAILTGASGLAGCSARHGSSMSTTPTPTQTPTPTSMTPTDGPVRWRYEVERSDGHADAPRNCINCTGLYHPPTVADGTVYVGGDRLAALDPADGSERWTYDTGPPTLSRPLIRDETAFVLSGYYDGHDYDDERVHAVDATTGEERWQIPHGSAATLVGATADSVYVAGKDDQVGVTGERTYALDAADGTARWSHETGDVLFPGRATGSAVYVGAPRGLVALDAATGEERWQARKAGPRFELFDETLYAPRRGGLSALDAAGGSERWRFTPPESYVNAWAVVDGTAYAGTYAGDLFALDATTGEERWHATLGEQVGAVAAGDGTAYLGTVRASAAADIYAFDAASGAERWRYASDDRSEVRAVTVGTAIYAVFREPHELVGLAPTDGSERWRVAPGAELRDPVIARETVYLGTETGTLYALND